MCRFAQVVCRFAHPFFVDLFSDLIEHFLFATTKVLRFLILGIFQQRNQ